MKAIEIESKTDSKGILKMNYPLNHKQKKVKVIILYEEHSQEEDEVLWLKSVSKNPAFDFLHDEAENIYTFENGEPVND
jgi:hypothetical protein